MIDAAQVQHVAALARLRLDEQETEEMAGELSTILDHIEAISALDLEGVEPTARIVDPGNALRPDEPHQSLARDVILAAAPETADDGFLVPSPQST